MAAGYITFVSYLLEQCLRVPVSLSQKKKLNPQIILHHLVSERNETSEKWARLGGPEVALESGGERKQKC